jgi:hypothetical protein
MLAGYRSALASAAAGAAGVPSRLCARWHALTGQTLRSAATSGGLGGALRFERSLGTPFHFIGRDIFHMRGNRPYVTERIFKGA